MFHEPTCWTCLSAPPKRNSIDKGVTNLSVLLLVFGKHEQQEKAIANLECMNGSKRSCDSGILALCDVTTIL
jgi:hypothetical protein